jgi:DedD protein
MRSSQDMEITLGMGRMLLVFFGLVGVCAVCFGLGYSMGHRNNGPATVAAAEQPARQPQTKESRPKAEAPDLTFYKTVQQGNDDPRLTPAEPSSPVPDRVAAKPESMAKRQPAAAVSAGAYMVQVAAVSKKEDADALLGALRRKNYKVSEATNLPHDKLYHVQIGPFSDIKQAEAARVRLVTDGYNPIVKK